MASVMPPRPSSTRAAGDPFLRCTRARSARALRACWAAAVPGAVSTAPSAVCMRRPSNRAACTVTSWTPTRAEQEQHPSRKRARSSPGPSAPALARCIPLSSAPGPAGVPSSRAARVVADLCSAVVTRMKSYRRWPDRVCGRAFLIAHCAGVLARQMMIEYVLESSYHLVCGMVRLWALRSRPSPCRRTL